jgi:GNAT superfamily N-acetyltransferase
MGDKLKISDSINLRTITLNDAASLLKLMHTIYIPPYKHLWQVSGLWYVQNTFNSVVLKEELSEKNAAYYFVEYRNKRIGILRIIHNVPYKDFENKKTSKLHRIYLDPIVHGKGIGKLLMDWSTQEAIDNSSQLLWLEAMDTQEQALKFYKKLGYQIAGDFKLEFELMHTHLRGMYRMFKIL